jgi:glycosyltransferase involved in cell wall biosynthesis
VVSLMQVMAGAPVGGAEAFFERLSVALDARPIEQTIVVRKNEDRIRRLRQAGIEPTALRFRGIFDLSTRANLKRLIDRTQPQVVLAWMNRATAMCPTPTAARRFILVARLGGYYNLKYYRHCDHLIANTQGIRRYLIERGWAPERVHYLPNFVEPSELEDGLLAASDLPAGARNIFAAGRFHENKGFDILIRSLPMVADAHLSIAGSGPLEQQLRSLAFQIGVADRITWLGWLESPSDCYRAADLFVCPSRHEPLGNVVVEAWAHGTPVVAAAAQGPVELISDGTDGVLTPIDDPTKLAKAITAVLAQPSLQQSLAAAGRERYLESFTKDVVVDQYMSFFERLVA